MPLYIALQYSAWFLRYQDVHVHVYKYIPFILDGGAVLCMWLISALSFSFGNLMEICESMIGLARKSYLSPTFCPLIPHPVPKQWLSKQHCCHRGHCRQHLGCLAWECQNVNAQFIVTSFSLRRKHCDHFIDGKTEIWTKVYSRH